MINQCVCVCVCLCVGGEYDCVREGIGRVYTCDYVCALEHDQQTSYNDATPTSYFHF